MTPGSVIAAVRFRPGTGGVALGLPLAAVRDQRVLLAELWGRAAADELADEVAAALAAEPPDGGGDPPALVPAGRADCDGLTGAIAGRAGIGAGPAGSGRVGRDGVAEPVLPQRPSGPEAAIVRAVARRVGGARAGVGPALASALAAEDGPGGVRRVADRLGVSERQLHRRSLTLFGYGPKTAQRILRFQRALRLARLDRAGGRGRAPGFGLAAVAAEAGYADQAHLARDVRALAGVTLSDLI
jgi:AraC-like DNA-binding protein